MNTLLYPTDSLIPNPCLIAIIVTISTHNGPQFVLSYPPEPDNHDYKAAPFRASWKEFSSSNSSSSSYSSLSSSDESDDDMSFSEEDELVSNQYSDFDVPNNYSNLKETIGRPEQINKESNNNANYRNERHRKWQKSSINKLSIDPPVLQKNRKREGQKKFSMSKLARSDRNPLSPFLTKVTSEIEKSNYKGKKSVDNSFIGSLNSIYFSKGGVGFDEIDDVGISQKLEITKASEKISRGCKVIGNYEEKGKFREFSRAKPKHQTRSRNNQECKLDDTGILDSKFGNGNPNSFVTKRNEESIQEKDRSFDDFNGNEGKQYDPLKDEIIDPSTKLGGASNFGQSATGFNCSLHDSIHGILGTSDTHISSSLNMLGDLGSTVLGFDTTFLSELLVPPRTMCNTQFELAVDDMIFLGMPIHVRRDGQWLKKRSKASKEKSVFLTKAPITPNVTSSVTIPDNNQTPSFGVESECNIAPLEQGNNTNLDNLTEYNEKISNGNIKKSTKRFNTSEEYSKLFQIDFTKKDLISEHSSSHYSYFDEDMVDREIPYQDKLGDIPTHLNGSGNSESGSTAHEFTDPNSDMRMFHVTFVVNPPVREYPERIAQMYQCIVARFARMLRYEQAKSNYVWKEISTILEIRDKTLQDGMKFFFFFFDIISNLFFIFENRILSSRVLG